MGRSREGAWIEIRVKKFRQTARYVAPVRERGLKYEAKLHMHNCFSRSREGAWIEIEDIFKLGFVTISRSREGAWIEIAVDKSKVGDCGVAPVRERGLK